MSRFVEKAGSHWADFIDWAAMMEESVPLEMIFGDRTQSVRSELGQEHYPALRLMGEDEMSEWVKGNRPTTCLQCGLCCFQYEVDGVPGYPDGCKPICEDCRHLRPPSLQNGRWTTSRCLIHRDRNRPAVCADFCGRMVPLVLEKTGPNGERHCEVPCAEGLRYWVRLYNMYGGEVPEKVGHFFPATIRERTHVCPTM